MATVKLLAAAAEILGGSDRLAQRIGIGQVLLSAYMTDLRELPDALLLRTVDIILEHRETHYGMQRSAEPVPKTDPGASV